MATLEELKGKLQTFADINRYLTLLRVPEADLELLSKELHAAEGADDETTRGAAFKNVEQLAVELERKVIAQAAQPSRQAAHENGTDAAQRHDSPEPLSRDRSPEAAPSNGARDEHNDHAMHDQPRDYDGPRRSPSPQQYQREDRYPSRSYSRGRSRSPSRPGARSSQGDDRWAGGEREHPAYQRSASPYAAHPRSRSPYRGPPRPGSGGPSRPPPRDAAPYRGRSPGGRGPPPSGWHQGRGRSYSPGPPKRPRPPSRSPPGRMSPKRYRQGSPPGRYNGPPRGPERGPPAGERGLMPHKFRDGMLLNLNDSSYATLMDQLKLRNMSGTDDIHRISDETMLVVWNFEKKHLCGVLQKAGMLRRIDSDTCEVPVNQFQRFVPLPEVIVEQVVQRQQPRGGFKKSKLFRTHLTQHQCELLWRCFNGKPI